MLNRLPILATLLVALAAGILAAVASRDVAIARGAVSVPALGWLTPVILEGAAVTSALLGYQRSARGERAWAERACLAAMLLLATVVNAAHCSSGDWLGITLSAAPPIVLLTSIELLLRNAQRSPTAAHTAILAPVLVTAPLQVPTEAPHRLQEAPGRPEDVTERPTPVTTSTSPQIAAQAPAQVEAPTPVVAEPKAVITPKPAQAANAAQVADERLAQIADWHEAGDTLSGSVVAERLGVSPATGRRLLRSFKETLAPVGVA